MNNTKPKLIIGQHYMVEVTHKGARGNKPPTVKVKEKMRLVEKQANGVLVMEKPAWKLLDPPFTGRRDHKYEPCHQLVKIKSNQIKGDA